MEAWLQTKNGERFQINGNCSIGRLPENNVVLDDVRVSRRHALVHANGSSGQWLVDFGSSNGVLLNGRRMRDPVQLRDRDCIEISGHAFIFHEKRSAQKASPKPDVTTERAAGKFAATGHGIIVLTSKGEVQCISELAQQWLKSYFASAQTNGSLPKELQHWIDRQNPTTKQQVSIPLFPETLFVPRENRRLAVRIAENSPNTKERARIFIRMQRHVCIRFV